MRSLEILRRRPLKAVITAAIAGAFGAVLLASALPARHETSIDFTVNLRERQVTTEYAYDGYYALRSTELFADTLISWFSTPSMVRSIFEAAGRAPDDASPLPMRLFRAKKFSSQNVVVRFSVPDHETAAALASAVEASVIAKAETLNPDAEGESLFIITASEPVFEERRLPPQRAAFVGFVLGAVAGLALAYSRKEEKAPGA